MTTTQDIPEGERLARIEFAVETLVRESSEYRADLRELRTELRSGFTEIRAEMQSRFAEMDSKFAEMQSSINSVRNDARTDLDRLNTKIDRNFLWTLGIMIPMWITIIIAVIAALLVN